LNSTLLSATGAAHAYARPTPFTPEPATDPGISGWFALALDEIDYGVLMLSADFGVVHCNHAARRVLAGTHPLRLVENHLCARTAADNELLACALGASRDRGLRRMLSFDGSGRRWMVAIVPMAPTQRGPGTLVVLGKSAACETLSAEGFARWYGLTPAEAAVLLALANGLRPGNIANHQGVALSTVRTHIARIREKTGVPSIAVLLDMVARLPPLVGALKC